MNLYDGNFKIYPWSNIEMQDIDPGNDRNTNQDKVGTYGKYGRILTQNVAGVYE